MIDPRIEKALLHLVDLLQADEREMPNYGANAAMNMARERVFTAESSAAKPYHGGYPEPPRVTPTINGNNERLNTLHDRINQLEAVADVVHSRMGAAHSPMQTTAEDNTLNPPMNGPIDYGDELINNAIRRVENLITVIENINMRIG